MKAYVMIAAIIAGFFLVVGSLRYGVLPGIIGAVLVAAVILVIGHFKTRARPPAA